MTILRGLDEYEDIELEKELRTRIHARANGLCDYCGRKPSEPPCKFPDRHTRPAREVEKAKRMSKLEGKVVHSLSRGRPRCHFVDVIPFYWPEGHAWCSDKKKVNCPLCLSRLAEVEEIKKARKAESAARKQKLAEIGGK